MISVRVGFSLLKPFQWQALGIWFAYWGSFQTECCTNVAVEQDLMSCCCLTCRQARCYVNYRHTPTCTHTLGSLMRGFALCHDSVRLWRKCSVNHKLDGFNSYRENLGGWQGRVCVCDVSVQCTDSPTSSGLGKCVCVCVCGGVALGKLKS